MSFIHSLSVPSFLSVRLLSIWLSVFLALCLTDYLLLSLVCLCLALFPLTLPVSLLLPLLFRFLSLSLSLSLSLYLSVVCQPNAVCFLCPSPENNGEDFYIHDTSIQQRELFSSEATDTLPITSLRLVVYTVIIVLLCFI